MQLVTAQTLLMRRKGPWDWKQRIAYNHINMLKVSFSWSSLNLMRFRVGRGYMSKYGKCPGCCRNLKPYCLVLVQAHASHSHVTCPRLCFTHCKIGIIFPTIKADYVLLSIPLIDPFTGNIFCNIFCD